MEDYNGFKLSFKERRQLKRFKKMMELEEGYEPGNSRIIAIRTAEVLIPLILLSAALALMTIYGVFKERALYEKTALSVCAGAYGIYILITSFRLFWAMRDVKKYLTANLGAFAVLALLSVGLRLCSNTVFSFAFYVLKVFAVIEPVSGFASLFISLGVILVIMLAMLINVKLDRLNEIQKGEE